MKQKHFIDAHKASNAFAILVVMDLHNAWDNATAWSYLAMHGSYGFLWLLKSFYFPDKQWEQSTNLGYGLLILLSLSLYWVAPWHIAQADVQPPNWYLAMCFFLFSIGVFYHFVADMQKYVHLRLRPGKLFTNGLWAHCRNPNYFGELLIYLGFSLLAMHWAPLAVLAFFVFGVWVPNMVRKDRSLARYPEFAAWKRRSSLFIPHLI